MITTQRRTFVPFDYQHRMIEWLRDKPRAALFAGCGLGKTVCTLKAYSDLIIDGECKGLLIVAPLRVCDITWMNEGDKWDFADHLKIANMRTEQGVQDWKDQSADIYLINFDQLASRDVNRVCKRCKNKRGKRDSCRGCGGEGYVTYHYPGFVEKYLKGQKPESLPVDSVMIDEISLAKNPSSKRVNALRNQRHLFTRFHGLTGTPIPNSYMDVWAPVRFLDEGRRLGKVFGHFKNKYFYSVDPFGYKWKTKRGTEDAIQKLISDICLVMRSEDYLDIPDTIVHDISVTLPNTANEQYEELKKELLLQLENGEIEALSAAVLTQKLLQVTSGAVYDAEREVHVIHDAKIKALKKLRNSKELKDKPLMILTSFKHESARILEAIEGSQKFHEKDMEAWRRGEISTWVADARSLSHGVDGIQDSCSNLVWFTPTYSNETYCQTNARIARTGQSHISNVYHLLCKGTMDDAVISVLGSKEGQQKELLAAITNLQRIEETKKNLIK